MGDISQFHFLKKVGPQTPVRVLEVGSLRSNNAQGFRELFPSADYVGIDMLAGEGVDAVVDLLDKPAMAALGEFDLIICTSVLEHVKKPWVAADHLTRCLKKGGSIYISVPWVWRYHPYPDDYFRFSHAGIKELFPKVRFDVNYYGTNLGEMINADEQGADFDNKMATFKKLKNGQRKYLPYLQLLMIGKRV